MYVTGDGFEELRYAYQDVNESVPDLTVPVLRITHQDATVYLVLATHWDYVNQALAEVDCTDARVQYGSYKEIPQKLPSTLQKTPGLYNQVAAEIEAAVGRTWNKEATRIVREDGVGGLLTFVEETIQKLKPIAEQIKATYAKPNIPTVAQPPS